jgi:predicted enzyme related to lactoylglutathione lyase
MTSASSDRQHPFGHGRLAYIQIPALDVNESAAFYKDIFGWKIRGGSPEHLSFTDATGDIIGAFVTDAMISTEPGVIFYIYVHGLDATLEKMVAAGSKVVRPPYPEGDLWVAILIDPAGNAIGIWQFAPR